MAKARAGGRVKAIMRIMVKPSGHDQDESAGYKGPDDSEEEDMTPHTNPPPEDGSDMENPSNASDISDEVSEAADGLEALAEKASPAKKPKLLAIVDQLRKCAMEEGVEKPSAHEKALDARKDKATTGNSAPPSMIY